MHRGLGASLATAVVLCTAAVAENSVVPDGFDVAVTPEGAVALPQVDFRADWTVLGAWSIDGDEGAEGLHVVYTQPGVAQTYRETGAFPDGAVLIKELLSAQTETLTTGTASYAADVSGWFVMVKDSTNRFPDNPLWGDGWGWGFFSAEAPANLVTQSYKTECKTCHVPARKTDWVYIRAYPVLKE